MLLRIVVLIGALVATWFGIMLLFFYEKFQVFNELLNNQYIVGKDKYGNGSGYSFDRWVMGWHTAVAILCLLLAAWLFSVFFSYLSL